MEETLFPLIYFNKWRFFALFVGMIVITGVLICAMIFDPMPWYGTLAGSVILGASWITGLYNYKKYKKWEKTFDPDKFISEQD